MQSRLSEQTRYEVFDDLPLTEHIEWNHQRVEGFYRTALNPFFWIKSQAKFLAGSKNRSVFDSPERRRHHDQSNPNNIA